VVDGSAGSHELDITGPPRLPVAGESAPGEPTAIGEGVLITPEDRAALVALFAGYLQDGPRYDPNPKSYNAAAARLGWPAPTVRKRIEHLRYRLNKAGVPNMTGWNALTNLAEYVLANRTITKDDLRLVYPDR
jgi:hypothetical protein